MFVTLPLEGVIQALSIFNTIAFLWLGLTVLLNAEQRAWGTWVAGGGLVVGGLFFAVHSVLFGSSIGGLRGELAWLWPLSWLPFVGLPFLWYLVMAWYTGVIQGGWHQKLIVGAMVVGMAALALLLVLGPLPPRRVTDSQLQAVLAFRGLPFTLLTYSAYSAGCVALSLLALWRPHDSQRFMGDVARRRARPWLVATSATLLAVSISVTALVMWFLLSFETRGLALLTGSAVSILDVFDLGVTGLMTLVGILVGRAVASYEIFTGKVLPRGGLRRQWRNSLVLAASFGILVGGGLIAAVDTMFLLVLASLLITVLYAVHSWRVYVEREESMRRLRPFLASERLYARLVESGAAADEDPGAPFRALCADVLETQTAFLVPVGALAGAALAYPARAAAPLAQLGPMADYFKSPRVLCLAIDSDLCNGAVWAVPLWGEKGPLGLLLLGPKTDDAPYTQEEIELARAAGERLVDIQASAAMARRLMILQRTHLSDTQVVDRRARRLLHDEILPQLHAVLLSISTPDAASNLALRNAVNSLVDVHQQIADLLRATPPALAPEVGRLGVFGALRQVVEVEFGGDFDNVTWDVDATVERGARWLSPTTAEVLFYAAREAIRNAARHGRGGDAGRPLRLMVSAQVDDDFVVIIQDDGVGQEATRTGERPGGHGLALHTTMMAVVGGALQTESVPEAYSRVRLSVPLVQLGETAAQFTALVVPETDALLSQAKPVRLDA